MAVQKKHISAELQHEVINQPLVVTGEVPHWLSGTLVRNGPVTVKIDGQSNEHWFDGLAMLHAFSFHKGKVNYSNQFLRSEAYHAVFDDGSLHYQGFAVDPCRALFKKFLTVFFPFSHPIHNANVNVAKLADAYVALTEIPLPVQFDLETLDTLGVLDYQDKLPKNNCWESAHPHYDHKLKGSLNYLIKYGKTNFYTFYSLNGGSSQRQIIAEIPVEKPAYMHSFAVTENYLILAEYPFVVAPFDLLMQKKPFIKNFVWHPEKGTHFIVVNRNTGKIVGRYPTKPFFAFHHINAFEENRMLHLDMITYEDASVITGNSFYIGSPKNPSDHPLPHMERFSLSLDSGHIASEVLLAAPNEFPRINEKFDGRPYRYVYSTAFPYHVSDAEEFWHGEGLYKFNVVTKEKWVWSEKECSAGEAVFVPTPNAQEEDDGIVLAVILDQQQKSSFLLILDGKKFTEIGRVQAPHAIPLGLHGQYFPV